MTTERDTDGDWRAYRCPVCSHSDGVSLGESDRVTIRCSHCDTPLLVQRKDSGSVSVTVSRADGADGEESTSQDV